MNVLEKEILLDNFKALKAHLRAIELNEKINLNDLHDLLYLQTKFITILVEHCLDGFK